jgi:anti-sigma regulatory factor (Ser/Thr protein kinase)
MNVTNASALVSPVIPAHPSSPDGSWLKAFPFRSFLELGAYREAAGSARGHARNVLAEWGLGHLADAVTHVLSELVANSVSATEKVAWAGGRPPVRMWLLGGGAPGAGEVLVCVWDAVPEVPVPRVAGEADESGRGLEIIAALAGRWDCYLAGGPDGGKVTRAWIDCPWREFNET